MRADPTEDAPKSRQREHHEKGPKYTPKQGRCEGVVFACMCKTKVERIEKERR